MAAARRLLVPLLALLLLTASSVLAASVPASAESACKGMNWVGNETGPDLANGRLVVAMDTCETGALVVRLRGEADELQNCVNVTSLAGTIFSFFLGTARVGVYIGAISGFTIAGSCTQQQTTLRGWANKLAEWNARCADHGVKFRMGVTDNRIFAVKDFVCQVDALPDNDKALSPTDEDVNYTDGTDEVSLQLVTAPQADSGAPCTSEPYYFHAYSAAESRDVYSVRLPQADRSWVEFRWNPDSGGYDIPAGPAAATCDVLPPEVPFPSSPYSADYVSGGQCWTAVVVDYSYLRRSGAKVVLRDVSPMPDNPNAWLWTYDFFTWDRAGAQWVQWYPDVPPTSCETSGPTG